MDFILLKNQTCKRKLNLYKKIKPVLENLSQVFHELDQ